MMRIVEELQKARRAYRKEIEAQAFLPSLSTQKALIASNALIGQAVEILDEVLAISQEIRKEVARLRRFNDEIEEVVRKEILKMAWDIREQLFLRTIKNPASSELEGKKTRQINDTTK